MATSIETKIDNIINQIQVKTAHRESHRYCTLESRMEELDTPGLSVAVIDSDEIVWSQGFGVKEYGTNDKIDENSMFLAASVSKPVFALVVMRLKEKGLVDLDKDVNEYLKGWKIPAVDGWQPKISLRQLLSHTAGVTVSGFDGYLKSEKIPTTIQILNGEKPANSREVIVNIIPGTTFRYSGGGVTIAQKAMEDLLGKPFPQIMEEELFIPLKLENSTFEQNLPESRKDQIVTAHTEKNQIVAGQYHLYPEMAAAGLWTTVNDLARITLEIQRAIKGESDFLQKETIEEMLTPQKIAQHMGISFFLEGKENTKRFLHCGSDEGFLTYWISYKDHSKAAVVMVNSNEGIDLLYETVNAIAKEFNWEDYIGEIEKEELLKSELLTQYTGNYKSDSDTNIEVSIEDEKLFLKVDKQTPLPLKATNESNFYLNKLNSKITFKFSEEKIVTKIVISQNGEELIAHKID